jgi:hypothetical protein
LTWFLLSEGIFREIFGTGFQQTWGVSGKTKATRLWVALYTKNLWSAGALACGISVSIFHEIKEFPLLKTQKLAASS